VKFVNRSVLSRLEKTLLGIEAPGEVKGSIDLEKARIVKLKEGLIAIGKNFVLGEGGYLVTFTKPSVAELVLKYLGMLDGD